MRGCQKRVIYMKNTGSEVFEEAYFVVKEDSSLPRAEGQIINEANRIIEENLRGERKNAVRPSVFRSFLLFASGFLIANILTLAVFMLSKG